jgi:hypothetical protein
VTDVVLRPLRLGEILDRTFSLYRAHFLLFVGIAGIPQLLILPLRLGQSWLSVSGTPDFWTVVSTTIAFWVAAILAYLFSQGGTILAVSDIYLGRSASIASSLSKVWGNLGFLFGVVALNVIATLLGMILLIIPGIYIACRLLVCVPVAMLEEKGPRDSLSRSFELTRDFAGRSFMILLLWIVISVAASLLFGVPFSTLMIFSGNNAGMLRLWAELTQVGSTFAEVLTSPILLIATSVFYYDLRVRKEAFDLQFMMNPDNTSAPGSPGVTSLFS